MSGEIASVIVAYESRATIEEAIRAVRDLGPVVVVDHGRDGTAKLADRLGVLSVSDPTNPGYGAGQNRGRAYVGGDWLLMLNPDAVIDAEAVRTGLRYLEARPDVAMVQGVITAADGTPERSQGVELGPVHLWGRALGLRRLLSLSLVGTVVSRVGVLRDHVVRAPESPVKVEYLAAVAPLVRRSAIVSVGGFDEAFFLYGEDLDLCHRLRRNGWQLVALPERWAMHVSGASSASSLERELVWWQGTMQFAAKWWCRRDYTLARLAAILRAASLVVMHPREGRRIWMMVARTKVA
jgi:hypothetical protein